MLFLISSPLLDEYQVHPSTSRRWNDELKAKGHSRIDAPVSGGVKASHD
jgi:3-hydroxyisobutyrate dehydrogenase-like beta-hydroxyacid dehydrogenase